MQRRIIDIGGHQLADPAVQGRGEEHPLAACGRLVEDAGDRGHEAQVGHVVRLVEHGDEDVGERAGMPLQQVNEPPWRRHDDVGVAHAGDLPADRHAAVDRGDAHADAATQRRERVGDLLGELAGRHEDQAAGGLLAPPVRGGREPGQHGQAEGQRLARPGSGRGRARRGRPAHREAPGPGSRTARGCHAPRAPGPAGRPGRARRTWPPSVAVSRRRRPGRDQARNAVQRAAAGGPGGAWPRPERGAWWCARRLGRSGRMTRADAWNYGACRKLHR